MPVTTRDISGFEFSVILHSSNSSAPVAEFFYEQANYDDLACTKLIKRELCEGKTNGDI